MYFRGTVGSETPTYTNNKAFTIDFTDACRTSTITAKNISLIAATFGTSFSQSVPAFEDSLAGGKYAFGICGELRVALVDSPSWLSLTMDPTDPTN